MKDRIQQLLAEIEAFKAQNKEELEQFRIKYLGKKGVMGELFSEFKNVPGELRKEIGVLLNDLKDKAQETINANKDQFDAQPAANQSVNDITLPVDLGQVGSHHPISIVRKEIIEIFSRLGFNVAEGPEIEDDWHNFSALNFPQEHPARDMQDTFFIEKDPDIALRTHTSLYRCV